MSKKNFDIDTWLAESEQAPTPSGEFNIDAFLADDKPPEVIEKVHPDLVGRTVVKNFSNDINNSINFLRKKNPGFDIREQDGRIIHRKFGEKDYTVLDPSGWTQYLKDPMELVRDGGDIMYDVGAGVAEGAAVAGGLAAAPMTGGLSLAAGVGAAGASGAGLEALRQKIGKELGINQDINSEDVMTSGALSAVLPGAGKLLSKAPKAIAKFSGISDDAVEGYMKQNDKFLKLEENEGADGFQGILKDNTQLIDDSLREAKDGISKEYEETANLIRGEFGARPEFDVRPAMGAYDDMLERATSKVNHLKSGTGEATSPEVDKMMEFLKDETDGILSNRVPSKEVSMDLVTGKVPEGAVPHPEKPGQYLIPEKLEKINGDQSFDALMELDEKLRRHARPEKIRSGNFRDQLDNSPGAEKTLRVAGIKARGAVKDQMEQAANAVGKSWRGIDDKFSDFKAEQEFFQKWFGTQDKMWSTMSSLNGQNKKVVLERKEKYLGPEKFERLMDDYKLIRANAELSDPTILPRSSQGVTSTSRTNIISDLSRDVGGLVGNAGSGGSYAATKAGTTAGNIAGLIGASPVTVRRMLDKQLAKEKAIAENPFLEYLKTYAPGLVLKETSSGSD